MQPQLKENTMRTFSRFVWWVATAFALVTIAACGGDQSAVEEEASGESPAQAVIDLALRLGTFEHVVGENRFGFVLLDQGEREIREGEVTARFFKVEGTEGTLRSQAPAEFIPIGVEEAGDEEQLNITGFWVVRPTFDAAGTWGIQTDLELPGGKRLQKQVSFEVLADSPAPMVGEPAPRTRNVLASEASDIKQVDTADPPDAFHDVRIADAIAAGRPLVVLFVTPEFCTSRTCGPTLEVAQLVAPEYEGRVDFVHVEIWSDFAAQKPRPEVTEWGLQNEPWVFLVDGQGNIAERFNSLLTVSELREGLDRMLAA